MNPFQLMAEPIRRRIIEILASGEHPSEMVNSMIRSEFGVSRAAVSRHLRMLREENWVEVRPEENLRHYRLAPDALASIEQQMDWLHHVWERRIGTVMRRLPEPSDVEPYVAQPRVGVRRGYRGRNRKKDHWYRDLYT